MRIGQKDIDFEPQGQAHEDAAEMNFLLGPPQALTASPDESILPSEAQSMKSKLKQVST